MVLLQYRLFESSGARAKNVPNRIQIRIAEKLIRRPVESVRAALHGHIDRPAARTSVLGAVVISNYLKLGNRVRRRLRHLVRKSLIAGAISIVIDAVHQKVIVSASQSIDREGSLPRRSGIR